MSRLLHTGRRWFVTTEDAFALVFLGVGLALALVAVLGGLTFG